MPRNQESHYTIYHACLDCRKAFKKLGAPHDFGNDRRFPCPVCGTPMRRMGRNFKPPRNANIAQWEKVRALIEQGYSFDRYGGSDYPKHPRDLEQFLREPEP